jgi:hypothetical protein
MSDCNGRDVKNLQEYIGLPYDKIKKLFARALLNDGFLSSFQGQVHASECVFSYPKSDWYGVYLLDASGNKYWNANGNTYQMYFFKLKFNFPDPSKPASDAVTTAGTFDMPPELVGKKQCVFNEYTKRCNMPKDAPATGVPTRPVKAAIAQAAKAAEGPSPTVAADVLNRLQDLSLGPGQDSKEKVPREYFENMKDKMLIVQWMIQEMKIEDLVSCIKRGNLSAADVRKAESVLENRPESVMDEPMSSSQAEEIAGNIVNNMPASESLKMLKKISKEDIIKDLKDKYPDMDERRAAIVNLCGGVGRKFVYEDRGKGMKLYDFKGKLVPDKALDIILDKCAEREAKFIRDRLVNKWKSAAREGKYLLKGKGPMLSDATFEAAPEESGPESAEDIIKRINAIEDEDARIQAIIDLSAGYGYTTQPGDYGVEFYDANGDQVTDDEALKECAELEAETMNSLEFGKKRKGSKRKSSKRKTSKGSQQNRFKMAAKKCKGNSNFRKCMSKMLRKSSFGKKSKVTTGKLKKYTSAGGRKSPGQSATKFPVGTVKTGLDGKLWVIKKASNGVKRWSKK